MRRYTQAQHAGCIAETRALRLLQRAGLTLIARNWLSPHGELDLVMEDGQTLVFIEVRQRRTSGHGSAAESIDKAKRMRIIRAARHFLQTREADPPPCRFDVVSINGSAARGPLRWLRSAFDTSDST